jgi:hypothetical protein
MSQKIIIFDRSRTTGSVGAASGGELAASGRMQMPGQYALH